MWSSPPSMTLHAFNMMPMCNDVLLKAFVRLSVNFAMKPYTSL